MTGAAIAYFLGQYHFKKLGYSKEILSDYVFGLLFVGIIGARIWYVIFMWNELYANNPMEIIMINHGGLAIQGGLITGLIYSYFFFKKRNISFFVAGDAIMPGVLIAGHIHIGNKVNLGAQSGVPSSIKDGSQLIGTPPMELKQYFKASIAQRSLPEMQVELRQLRKELNELKQQLNK